MAGEVQDQVWPLPKFYFSVKLGDDDSVNFQEVSGLDSETRPIEYRHGNSPSFYPIKMPGLGKVGNVTMRKGIFVTDSKLFSWYSEIKMNTIKRRTVVINLLDELGNPKWCGR
jgi:phage tail-like protein